MQYQGKAFKADKYSILDSACVQLQFLYELLLDVGAKAGWQDPVQGESERCGQWGAGNAPVWVPPLPPSPLRALHSLHMAFVPAELRRRIAASGGPAAYPDDSGDEEIAVGTKRSAVGPADTAPPPPATPDAAPTPVETSPFAWGEAGPEAGPHEGKRLRSQGPLRIWRLPGSSLGPICTRLCLTRARL